MSMEMDLLQIPMEFSTLLINRMFLLARRIQNFIKLIELPAAIQVS